MSSSITAAAPSASAALPQYGATSGLLEYSLPAGEGEGAAGEAAASAPPGLPKARLPFSQQDVQQGSGSLRPGDHVTFRIATNLQVTFAATRWQWRPVHAALRCAALRWQYHCG